MKDLIKGMLVCIFMMNMVYVMDQQNKKKSIAYDQQVNERMARMKAVNREMSMMLVEHEINKQEVSEPVIAGY